MSNTLFNSTFREADELNLIFRSSVKIEKRQCEQQGQANRGVQRRRHRVRMVLLVLDYAVEFVGGSFMFIVFFVGENKVAYSLLYQRILFCIGTFIYGIPIPIAYLYNESRVRNVIVKHDWIEGLRAIFYSNQKIRNLERELFALSVINPQGHDSANDYLNIIQEA